MAHTTVTHWIAYTGDACRIHTGDCGLVAPGASMGAALTRTEALASGLPLCGGCCPTDAWTGLPLDEV